MKRIKQYSSVSSSLAELSNAELQQILADAKLMHEGIGGISLKIEINKTPIFVKKIPVTDKELQPENYMSTANIFNLPICYQYGVGSAGFGVWRELSSHITTTNWVITNKCSNFPIMYHWRILKEDDCKIISDEDQAALDNDIAYWENNPSINNRLKEKILATHHIYLFLEFIPSHLYDWLNKQLSGSENSAIIAIKLIENQMQEINNFMRSQKFLHMDAHFKNILTDGKQLYYTDFGLALTDKFTLSNIEKKFIKDHKNYDDASCIVNFMHSVLSSYLGKKDWDSILSKFNDPNFEINIPISVKRLLSKYSNIALIMHKFFKAAQKDKSTLYPATELEKLINTISSEIK
jgi:hypothetical protein